MADITTEELEELENEVVSKDDNIKTMQEFVSPESLYQELIASVKKYHPSTDISLIERHIRQRIRHIRDRYENPVKHISFIRCVWQLF